MAALYEVFVQAAEGAVPEEGELEEVGEKVARMALRAAYPTSYATRAGVNFRTRTVLRAERAEEEQRRIGMGEGKRLEMLQLRERALSALALAWEENPRHREKLDLVLSLLSGEYDPARLAAERGVDRNTVEQHKRRGCLLLLKRDPSLAPALAVYGSKTRGMRRRYGK
jgi:hypothetical protein